MSSRQLSSRIARRTRPSFIRHRHSWLKTFLGNRARETGYGVFFASVFLLCQSPAQGLGLNDIRVLSRLGDPLIAEVVVTTAAGETLSRGCFSTKRSTGDLPGVGTVRLTLTRTLNANVLSIAGSRPLREPMSEFVLQVKCPGVPTMVKSFLVMVDPPSLNGVVTSPATTGTPVTTTAPARPARARAPSRDSIQPGSQYRVRPGDMLSTIAARVSGRPNWSVWPIAQQIYANNPGAFLLGNPNVIAEGAVVFIPRLADIDMSASAAEVRPPPAADTPAPATVVAPAIVAAPASIVAAPASIVAAPAAVPAPVAVTSKPVPTVARILPTPAAVTAPATPLPVMQLTTRLLSESQIKVLLRAQGSPVFAPAVVASTPEAPAGSPPEPQSEPDRPVSAVTDTRALLQPGQPVQTDSRLSWLWIVIGLLTGLLMGALAAVGLFRHNLRREYEHDLLEGVQRQVHTDRMRLQRDQAMASTAGSGKTPVVAATMDLSPTAETATIADHTMEIPKGDGLDFELSDDEPAKTGAPETLEMPGVASDLDLELPVDTGKTGQHEVDFDLLEAAYSEDYEAEFLNPGAATDNDTAESGDEAERYYHLENRDPTDESPLPIEMGEDEMGDGDDTDGDSKVVRFRR